MNPRKLYWKWSGTATDTRNLLLQVKRNLKEDMPDCIQNLPERQFMALFQAALARNVVVAEIFDMMKYIFENEKMKEN